VQEARPADGLFFGYCAGGNHLFLFSAQLLLAIIGIQQAAQVAAQGKRSQGDPGLPTRFGRGQHIGIEGNIHFSIQIIAIPGSLDLWHGNRRIGDGVLHALVVRVTQHDAPGVLGAADGIVTYRPHGIETHHGDIDFAQVVDVDTDIRVVVVCLQ